MAVEASIGIKKIDIRRRGSERVPATFKVRGNDDQVGDGENDKRSRGRGGGKHRMLKLHQKDNESDEDFQQRKMDRRMKKQKNNNKGRGDNEEGGGGEEEEDGKRRKKEKLTKKQREEMEDNATEGEELENAIERKKKKLEKEDKKIRNKAFRDDEKYRPKRPVSKFLPMIKKKVLPPVWPSVHLINDKLKQFCTKHDSITFFDATEFFASKEEGGRHHLYNELISPRGHPTELGFQRWENEIRDRLQKLIPPEPEEEEVAEEKENMSEGEVTDDYTILEENDDGVEVGR